MLVGKFELYPLLKETKLGVAQPFLTPKKLWLRESSKIKWIEFLRVHA